MVPVLDYHSCHIGNKSQFHSYSSLGRNMPKHLAVRVQYQRLEIILVVGKKYKKKKEKRKGKRQKEYEK